MLYSVFIERHAQRQIKKLDPTAIVLVKNVIASLSENPRPVGYIKLKGENAFRIKAGIYRIIYEIDDYNISVLVVAVGHRKEIYRKR